jgi:hypothetical protein
MLRIMDIDLQLAREHHAEGERLLTEAEAMTPGFPGEVADRTSLAAAHFAASMSATGILLSTDVNLDWAKE